MKLQLTQHNESFTINTNTPDDDDAIIMSELLEYMVQLASGAGYSTSSIEEAIIDKACEFNDREDTGIRIVEKEIRSSFEDESFMRDRATAVLSRYNEPRYFYQLDDNTIFFNFFDDGSVSTNFGEDYSIYSIDPVGGPFISVGTNLHDYISEHLPDSKVTSISYDNNKGTYVLKLDK